MFSKIPTSSECFKHANHLSMVANAKDRGGPDKGDLASARAMNLTYLNVKKAEEAIKNGMNGEALLTLGILMMSKFSSTEMARKVASAYILGAFSIEDPNVTKLMLKSEELMSVRCAYGPDAVNAIVGIIEDSRDSDPVVAAIVALHSEGIWSSDQGVAITRIPNTDKQWKDDTTTS